MCLLNTLAMYSLSIGKDILFAQIQFLLEFSVGNKGLD